MAYTVATNYDLSKTVYCIIFDKNGDVWNGSTFVTFDGVNATFDVALTEDTSRTGYYSAALGADPAQGTYFHELWDQAGGSPDRSADFRFAREEHYWEGAQDLQRHNLEHRVEIGELQYTYTSLNATGGMVTGCAVWVTTDAAGSNVVANDVTHVTAGTVDFYLDAGTYRFWRQKTGITFSNPESVVVTGPTFTAENFVIDADTDIGLTLYAILFDAAGNCWNGSSFATFDGDNDNFDLSMPEHATAGGHYASTAIAGPDPGVYFAETWEQAATAADRSADTRLGVEEIYWKGAYRLDWARVRHGPISGDTAYTYTLTETGGAPIEGARVIVTTDSAGANAVASGITDVFGQIDFVLDAGTYYFWAKLGSYNFTWPDEQAVS
jgi:hypothetical protein